MRYTFEPQDGYRHSGITEDVGDPNSTPVAPTAAPPGMMNAWNGTAWEHVQATPARPRWTDANLDQRYHQIHLGRLNARMGMDALAVAASDHPACRAAVSLLSMSEYVWLTGPEAQQILGMLAAAGQPEASPNFPGSGPITAEKIAVYLNPRTTEYERFVKGLPEPM